jgi:hypothetical protein
VIAIVARLLRWVRHRDRAHSTGYEDTHDPRPARGATGLSSQ